MMIHLLYGLHAQFIHCECLYRKSINPTALFSLATSLRLSPALNLHVPKVNMPKQVHSGGMKQGSETQLTAGHTGTRTADVC